MNLHSIASRHHRLYGLGAVLQPNSSTTTGLAWPDISLSNRTACWPKLTARHWLTAGHHVASAPAPRPPSWSLISVKPAIVMLELQLVEHSGIEFLYEFRSYPEWQRVSR